MVLPRGRSNVSSRAGHSRAAATTSASRSVKQTISKEKGPSPELMRAVKALPKVKHGKDTTLSVAKPKRSGKGKDKKSTKQASDDDEEMSEKEESRSEPSEDEEEVGEEKPQPPRRGRPPGTSRKGVSSHPSPVTPRVASSSNDRSARRRPAQKDDKQTAKAPFKAAAAAKIPSPATTTARRQSKSLAPPPKRNPVPEKESTGKGEMQREKDSQKEVESKKVPRSKSFAPPPKREHAQESKSGEGKKAAIAPSKAADISSTPSGMIKRIFLQSPKTNKMKDAEVRRISTAAKTQSLPKSPQNEKKTAKREEIEESKEVDDSEDDREAPSTSAAAYAKLEASTTKPAPPSARRAKIIACPVFTENDRDSEKELQDKKMKETTQRYLERLRAKGHAAPDAKWSDKEEKEEMNEDEISEGDEDWSQAIQPVQSPPESSKNEGTDSRAKEAAPPPGRREATAIVKSDAEVEERPRKALAADTPKTATTLATVLNDLTTSSQWSKKKAPASEESSSGEDKPPVRWEKEPVKSKSKLHSSHLRDSKEEGRPRKHQTGATSKAVPRLSTSSKSLTETTKRSKKKARSDEDSNQDDEGPLRRKGETVKRTAETSSRNTRHFKKEEGPRKTLATATSKAVSKLAPTSKSLPETPKRPKKKETSDEEEEDNDAEEAPTVPEPKAPTSVTRKAPAKEKPKEVELRRASGHRAAPPASAESSDETSSDEEEYSNQEAAEVSAPSRRTREEVSRKERNEEDEARAQVRRADVVNSREEVNRRRRAPAAGSSKATPKPTTTSKALPDTTNRPKKKETSDEEDDDEEEEVDEEESEDVDDEDEDEDDASSSGSSDDSSSEEEVARRRTGKGTTEKESIVKEVARAAVRPGVPAVKSEVKWPKKGDAAVTKGMSKMASGSKSLASPSQRSSKIEAKARGRRTAHDAVESDDEHEKRPTTAPRKTMPKDAQAAAPKSTPKLTTSKSLQETSKRRKKKESSDDEEEDNDPRMAPTAATSKAVSKQGQGASSKATPKRTMKCLPETTKRPKKETSDDEEEGDGPRRPPAASTPKPKSKLASATKSQTETAKRPKKMSENSREKEEEASASAVRVAKEPRSQPRKAPAKEESKAGRGRSDPRRRAAIKKKTNLTRMKSGSEKSLWGDDEEDSDDDDEEEPSPVQKDKVKRKRESRHEDRSVVADPNVSATRNRSRDAPALLSPYQLEWMPPVKEEEKTNEAEDVLMMEEGRRSNGSGREANDHGSGDDQEDEEASDRSTSSSEESDGDVEMDPNDAEEYGNDEEGDVDVLGDDTISLQSSERSRQESEEDEEENKDNANMNVEQGEDEGKEDDNGAGEIVREPAPTFPVSKVEKGAISDSKGNEEWMMKEEDAKTTLVAKQSERAASPQPQAPVPLNQGTAEDTPVQQRRRYGSPSPEREENESPNEEHLVAMLDGCEEDEQHEQVEETIQSSSPPAQPPVSMQLSPDGENENRMPVRGTSPNRSFSPHAEDDNLARGTDLAKTPPLLSRHSSLAPPLVLQNGQEPPPLHDFLSPSLGGAQREHSIFSPPPCLSRCASIAPAVANAQKELTALDLLGRMGAAPADMERALAPPPQETTARAAPETSTATTAKTAKKSGAHAATQAKPRSSGTFGRPPNPKIPPSGGNYADRRPREPKAYPAPGDGEAELTAFKEQFIRECELKVSFEDVIETPRPQERPAAVPTNKFIPVGTDGKPMKGEVELFLGKSVFTRNTGGKPTHLAKGDDVTYIPDRHTTGFKAVRIANTSIPPRGRPTETGFLQEDEDSGVVGTNADNSLFAGQAERTPAQGHSLRGARSTRGRGSARKGKYDGMSRTVADQFRLGKKLSAQDGPNGSIANGRGGRVVVMAPSTTAAISPNANFSDLRQEALQAPRLCPTPRREDNDGQESGSAASRPMKVLPLGRLRNLVPPHRGIAAIALETEAPELGEGADNVEPSDQMVEGDADSALRPSATHQPPSAPVKRPTVIAEVAKASTGQTFALTPLLLKTDKTTGGVVCVPVQAAVEQPSADSGPVPQQEEEILEPVSSSEDDEEEIEDIDVVLDDYRDDRDADYYPDEEEDDRTYDPNEHLIRGRKRRVMAIGPDGKRRRVVFELEPTPEREEEISTRSKARSQRDEEEEFVERVDVSEIPSSSSDIPMPAAVGPPSAKRGPGRPRIHPVDEEAEREKERRRQERIAMNPAAHELNQRSNRRGVRKRYPGGMPWLKKTTTNTEETPPLSAEEIADMKKKETEKQAVLTFRNRLNILERDKANMPFKLTRHLRQEIIDFCMSYRLLHSFWIKHSDTFGTSINRAFSELETTFPKLTYLWRTKPECPLSMQLMSLYNNGFAPVDVCKRISAKAFSLIAEFNVVAAPAITANLGDIVLPLSKATKGRPKRSKADLSALTRKLDYGVPAMIEVPEYFPKIGIRLEDKLIEHPEIHDTWNFPPLIGPNPDQAKNVPTAHMKKFLSDLERAEADVAKARRHPRQATLPQSMAKEPVDAFARALPHDKDMVQECHVQIVDWDAEALVVRPREVRQREEALARVAVPTQARQKQTDGTISVHRCIPDIVDFLVETVVIAESFVDTEIRALCTVPEQFLPTPTEEACSVSTTFVDQYTSRMKAAFEDTFASFAGSTQSRVFDFISRDNVQIYIANKLRDLKWKWSGGLVPNSTNSRAEEDLLSACFVYASVQSLRKKIGTMIHGHCKLDREPKMHPEATTRKLIAWAKSLGRQIYGKAALSALNRVLWKFWRSKAVENCSVFEEVLLKELQFIEEEFKKIANWMKFCDRNGMEIEEEMLAKILPADSPPSSTKVTLMLAHRHVINAVLSTRQLFDEMLESDDDLKKLYAWLAEMNEFTPMLLYGGQRATIPPFPDYEIHVPTTTMTPEQIALVEAKTWAMLLVFGTGETISRGMYIDSVRSMVNAAIKGIYLMEEIRKQPSYSRTPLEPLPPGFRITYTFTEEIGFIAHGASFPRSWEGDTDSVFVPETASSQPDDLEVMPAPSVAATEAPSGSRRLCIGGHHYRTVPLPFVPSEIPPLYVPLVPPVDPTRQPRKKGRPLKNPPTEIVDPCILDVLHELHKPSVQENSEAPQEVQDEWDALEPQDALEPVEQHEPSPNNRIARRDDPCDRNKALWSDRKRKNEEYVPRDEAGAERQVADLVASIKANAPSFEAAPRGGRGRKGGSARKANPNWPSQIRQKEVKQQKKLEAAIAEQERQMKQSEIIQKMLHDQNLVARPEHGPVDEGEGPSMQPWADDAGAPEEWGPQSPPRGESARGWGPQSPARGDSPLPRSRSEERRKKGNPPADVLSLSSDSDGGDDDDDSPFSRPSVIVPLPSNAAPIGDTPTRPPVERAPEIPPTRLEAPAVAAPILDIRRMHFELPRRAISANPFTYSTPRTAEDVRRSVVAQLEQAPPPAAPPVAPLVPPTAHSERSEIPSGSAPQADVAPSDAPAPPAAPPVPPRRPAEPSTDEPPAKRRAVDGKDSVECPNCQHQFRHAQNPPPPSNSAFPDQQVQGATGQVLTLSMQFGRSFNYLPFTIDLRPSISYIPPAAVRPAQAAARPAQAVRPVRIPRVPRSSPVPPAPEDPSHPPVESAAPPTEAPAAAASVAGDAAHSPAADEDRAADDALPPSTEAIPAPSADAFLAPVAEAEPLPTEDVEPAADETLPPSAIAPPAADADAEPAPEAGVDPLPSAAAAPTAADKDPIPAAEEDSDPAPVAKADSDHPPEGAPPAPASPYGFNSNSSDEDDGLVIDVEGNTSDEDEEEPASIAVPVRRFNAELRESLERVETRQLPPTVIENRMDGVTRQFYCDTNVPDTPDDETGRRRNRLHLDVPEVRPPNAADAQVNEQVVAATSAEENPRDMAEEQMGEQSGDIDNANSSAANPPIPAEHRANEQQVAAEPDNDDSEETTPGLLHGTNDERDVDNESTEVNPHGDAETRMDVQQPVAELATAKTEQKPLRLSEERVTENDENQLNAGHDEIPPNVAEEQMELDNAEPETNNEGDIPNLAEGQMEYEEEDDSVDSDAAATPPVLIAQISRDQDQDNSAEQLMEVDDGNPLNEAAPQRPALSDRLSLDMLTPNRALFGRSIAASPQREESPPAAPPAVLDVPHYVEMLSESNPSSSSDESDGENTADDEEDQNSPSEESD